MNSVNIIGNLTRDPELKYTQSGKAVLNMSIAVSDAYNKDNTYFFDVVVWGKQAESCSQYLTKGKKAGITGRLQSRSYEDKTGNKRKVVEIVAERVDFLSPAGSRPAQDNWSDLGREVDMGEIDTDEDVPF